MEGSCVFVIVIVALCVGVCRVEEIVSLRDAELERVSVDVFREMVRAWVGLVFDWVKSRVDVLPESLGRTEIVTDRLILLVLVGPVFESESSFVWLVD